MTGTITISSPPAAEAKAALAAAEQSLSNAEELIERLRDSITAAQEAAADARRERKKLTLPAARGDRAAGERLKDLRKQEFDCEAQVADAAFAVEEAERERDAARDAVLRAKKAVTLAHALEVGAELVRQGADIDRILGELVPAMRRHDELVIELLALRVVDQAHVTILANLPDRFAGAAAVFPELSLGDLSVAEFDTLVAKRLRLPKRLHCYA